MLSLPGRDRGLFGTRRRRRRGGPGAGRGGARRAASARPQGERFGPGRLQRAGQPGGRGPGCPKEGAGARDCVPGAARGRLRSGGRSFSAGAAGGPRGGGCGAARPGRHLAPRSLGGTRPVRRLEPGPGAAAGLPQAAPELHPERPGGPRRHRRRARDFRSGRLLAGARPAGPGGGHGFGDSDGRRRNGATGRRRARALRGPDLPRAREPAAARRPASGARLFRVRPLRRGAPRGGGARAERGQGRRRQHRDHRAERRLLRVAPGAPLGAGRCRVGAGGDRRARHALRGTGPLGAQLHSGAGARRRRNPQPAARSAGEDTRSGPPPPAGAGPGRPPFHHPPRNRPLSGAFAASTPAP